MLSADAVDRGQYPLVALGNAIAEQEVGEPEVIRQLVRNIIRRIHCPSKINVRVSLCCLRLKCVLLTFRQRSAPAR